MHVLGHYGKENAAAIFELFLECMPEYPLDKPDNEGNTGALTLASPLMSLASESTLSLPVLPFLSSSAPGLHERERQPVPRHREGGGSARSHQQSGRQHFQLPSRNQTAALSPFR